MRRSFFLFLHRARRVCGLPVSVCLRWVSAPVLERRGKPSPSHSSPLCIAPTPRTSPFHPYPQPLTSYANVLLHLTMELAAIVLLIVVFLQTLLVLEGYDFARLMHYMANDLAGILDLLLGQ